MCVDNETRTGGAFIILQICCLSGMEVLRAHMGEAVSYVYVRLSSTTTTQNTRPICRLGSVTGKEFNTYFLSSSTTRPKR